MGKPVAEKFVNIVDDGTIPGLRGTINVDDEGNDSRKTVLVENGVLNSYMHDRISAQYYKVNPTGNGRRQSFRYNPIPRMRNTYMPAGPHDPEEILRSVKKGSTRRSSATARSASERATSRFTSRPGT